MKTEEMLFSITDELSVLLQLEETHSFLMRTSQVAKCFGVTRTAIILLYKRKRTLLIEGVHFIKVDNYIMWTLLGLDILCNLLINKSQNNIIRKWLVSFWSLQPKTNYYQLSINQVIDIDKFKPYNLSINKFKSIVDDVMKITNPELKKSILTKLMGGQKL